MFLLAILGGLILNVMPCVLPVISLKVLSFVKQAGESRGRLLFLGLAYCLGVLASFWLLALVMIILKATSNADAWGALFQYPLFVIGVTAIVFVLALNLLGVFEIRAPSGSAVQGLTQLERREGPVGAFFTGVLATVLATPCSAPYLGVAVTFALAQPAAGIFLIFTGVGVGLALPFALLSAFPAWTKLIPKPGQWMIVFKQVMGFLLLATAVWLLSIVAAQLGREGLIWTMTFLLCLGIACWLIGTFINALSPLRRRVAIWGAAIILAGASYAYCVQPVLNPPEAEQGIAWEAYSPARVDELLAAGQPVFVDFTAKWCLTCKANERLVIDTEEVRAALRKFDVATLKADYTRQDPVIKKTLNEFGRSGVPMYLIYPKDGATPILLPEVITKAMVVEALQKAGGKT